MRVQIAKSDDDSRKSNNDINKDNGVKLDNEGICCAIKITGVKKDSDDVNHIKSFFKKVYGFKFVFKPEGKKYYMVRFDTAEYADKALKINLKELGDNAKA